MKRFILPLLILWVTLPSSAQDTFPDGTPISAWFGQTEPTDITALGTAYVITQHGVVADSTRIQTESIQAVIDKAAAHNGGVVVIPPGTFLTGALFFKPGTHLHLQAGAKLKGSDDIADFPLKETRMEGQTLHYFCALINVEHTDGFTLSGKGTIDGNGMRYWKSFWLRRAYNPQCTNMEELRPRLVYVSHSQNVQFSGVTLQNSPFWTTHFYQCQNVKLLDLTILSPAAPVKAPSTDAFDLDVCRNVLVKGCYMSVNDDAVALKGGKGPWADQDPNNGGNENIIIEDCTYGFCHSALTLGSESIHNRNIILRRVQVNQAERLLWLKMRPDTPQIYEYITVEHITGQVNNFLFIHPWTQFFDLKGRADIPLSYAHHVTMRNCTLTCQTFFNVQQQADQYQLAHFTLENLTISATDDGTFNETQINELSVQNVTIR